MKSFMQSDVELRRACSDLIEATMFLELIAWNLNRLVSFLNWITRSKNHENNHRWK